AAAYYYRGLARSDVRERKGAIADLKAASRLYRSRGNRQGARKAESQLRRMRRRTLSSPLQKVWSSGVDYATALVNPVGTLGSLFRALSLKQASALGFGMALLSIVVLVTSANAYWPELVSLTWYHLALLGAVPFVTTGLVCSLSSLLTRRRLGSLSSDVFVAGSVLTPVGVGSLMSGLRLVLGDRILWPLALAVLCFTIMIFYAGLTQVSRFSEGQATWIIVFCVLTSALLIERLYGLILLL
ncbi:MAG: hypothetical protein AAGB01_12410, partial [Cyanobacteria bacterium P01_F01_bin.42]